MIFLLIFLGCASLVSYALYLQLVKNLLPCPLCVVQRIAYWSVGLTALLAFFHSPRATGRRIYSGLLAGFAVAGAESLCVTRGWCAFRRHLNAASVRKKNF